MAEPNGAATRDGKAPPNAATAQHRNAPTSPAPRTPPQPTPGQRAAIAAKSDRAVKQLDTSKSSSWPAKIERGEDVVIILELRQGDDIVVSLTAVDEYHWRQGHVKVRTPEGGFVCESSYGGEACRMIARTAGDYAFIVGSATGSGSYMLILAPSGGPPPIAGDKASTERAPKARAGR